MVNSETCFRYLGYLMYLVPEVPVGPVVPANLISEILVSPAFQKYSTPMVNIPVTRVSDVVKGGELYLIL